MNAFQSAEHASQRKGTWVLPSRRKTDNPLMITLGPNASARQFVMKMEKMFKEGSKKPEDFSFKGLQLKGVDLRGVDMRSFGEQALREIDFTGANLSGQNFSNLALSKASFEGANLNSTNFEGAILDGAHMNNAKLGCAEFFGARAHGTNMNHAEMQGAGLQADFRGAQTAGSDLTGGYIGGATNFENAQMRDANLTGVRMHEKDIEGPSFVGADLTGAVLRGMFRRGDFTGATMVGAKMEGGQFEFGLFADAIMTGATIDTKSNFSEASIEYAKDFPSLPSGEQSGSGGGEDGAVDSSLKKALQIKLGVTPNLEAITSPFKMPF